MAYTLKGKLQAIIDGLGTPAGDSMAADIAAIKALVDSLDVASIQAIVDEIEGTDFSSTTDSLKILSDNLDTVDGLVDDIKAKTDNLPASPCATADVANALVDVKHKDIGATFDPATDSLEAISDKLGVLGGATVQSYLYNISLAAGAPLRKEVTFADTAAAVPLFTVTGAVRVKITAVCTTGLASAGGCNIGLKAGTVDLIAATDATALAAGELWFDNSPTETTVTVATSTLEFNIGDGGDILIDVESAKQVDSGAMTFYVEWAPITGDGNVSVA